MSDVKISRMNNWADVLVKQSIDEEADQILEHLKDQFADMSREDILKKLITTQLDHLRVESGETANLNFDEKGNRESKRGDDRKDSKHYQKYFINVGFIDGLTKSDLIHFLSDATGVKRKNIGNVQLKQNHAFFEMERKHAKGIEKMFDGFFVDDRAVRVNLEDEGSSKPKHSIGGSHSHSRRRKGAGPGRGSRPPKPRRGRR